METENRPALALRLRFLKPIGAEKRLEGMSTGSSGARPWALGCFVTLLGTAGCSSDARDGASDALTSGGEAGASGLSVSATGAGPAAAIDPSQSGTTTPAGGTGTAVVEEPPGPASTPPSKPPIDASGSSNPAAEATDPAVVGMGGGGGARSCTSCGGATEIGSPSGGGGTQASAAGSGWGGVAAAGSEPPPSSAGSGGSYGVDPTMPTAFPGAQGFGRFARGARGGDVYHVTNLDDSGPGSLRDAISEPNRTVVFEVSGVIEIASRLVFKNNQTIAGQTAPGGGITVYGDGTSFSAASNTIVRYMRFRMGKIGESEKDTVTMANGHDVIWDHCSLSWGRDANFDLNQESGEELYNLTLQDSIVAQGLQSHSTGGIANTTGTSLIRSLYIDNNSRNPKARGTLQFVNNVVYNWVASGYILGDTSGRSDGAMVGNYFISGPETDGGTLDSPTPEYHVFAVDNWYDSNKDGTLDGRLLGEGDFGIATWEMTPSVEYPDVPALSAEEAFAYVRDNAGASLFRDAVDDYIVRELESLGTSGATISDETSLGIEDIVGVVPAGEPPVDADRDGMADSWEGAAGLDPNDPEDRNDDRNGDGWTNLEEYVNSLVP